MSYPKAYVDKLRRMYNYRREANAYVLDDAMGEIDLDSGLSFPRVILISEIDAEECCEGESGDSD